MNMGTYNSLLCDSWYKASHIVLGECEIYKEKKGGNSEGLLYVKSSKGEIHLSHFSLITLV